MKYPLDNLHWRNKVTTIRLERIDQPLRLLKVAGRQCRRVLAEGVNQLDKGLESWSPPSALMQHLVTCKDALVL